jgi:hypothetical protein
MAEIMRHTQAIMPERRKYVNEAGGGPVTYAVTVKTVSVKWKILLAACSG